MLACCTLTLPLTASAADAEYYGNLSNEELNKIFSIKVDDIPNAWQWITDSNTFLLIEKRGSVNTFWWNTPNMQETFYNMLYGQIAQTGYGYGAGEDPKTSNNIDIAGKNGADNAMQRYGFHLQNPTYVGERPLITMSVLGVLKPDSIFDGVGRAFKFVFSGEIVGFPSDSDLDNLVYVAPRDYNLAGATFYNWINENWEQACLHFIQTPGQILLKTADEDGYKDGKQWVVQNIILDEGLADPGLDPEYIVSELEILCGKYYGDVAEGIMLTSGIDDVHTYERIMPYDIGRMNAEDAALFDGIYDPRAQHQENLISTGYLNHIGVLLSDFWKNSTASRSSGWTRSSYSPGRPGGT